MPTLMPGGASAADAEGERDREEHGRDRAAGEQECHRRRPSSCSQDEHQGGGPEGGGGRPDPVRAARSPRWATAALEPMKSTADAPKAAPIDAVATPFRCSCSGTSRLTTPPRRPPSPISARLAVTSERGHCRGPRRPGRPPRHRAERDHPDHRRHRAAHDQKPPPPPSVLTSTITSVGRGDPAGSRRRRRPRGRRGRPGRHPGARADEKAPRSANAAPIAAVLTPLRCSCRGTSRLTAPPSRPRPGAAPGQHAMTGSCPGAARSPTRSQRCISGSR